MIIGNSAIQHFASKAVAHTHFDPTEKDAYTVSAMAGASAPVAAIAGSNDSWTASSTDQGYNESFAKMMVNLKAAMANTTASVSDDDKAAAAAAFSSSADKQIAATDSVTKTVDNEMAAVDGSDSGTSATSSAKEQFLAYMNQTDAEKVRQQLTGVSKEEYDGMSPEQQAAVDKKVADLQKQKQEQQIAEQEVKTKIAMAKAEMA
ncbi:hypothetical protein [Pseudomonas abietaniphila]|uniref:Uncharacterized protein n=1 Tax=Pseudomonas abietaniphila TaxID=89065 RepID=A0A1G7SJ30_9PSED|nr:hypothetical protein [Pseudomonas abietaniphila]SDG23003.1 hypothetical protein SAMN05216605_101470 [Pseudomonas abietaniphila]